jgi:aspartate kinase
MRMLFVQLRIIPSVAGFQGFSRETKDIATLGRGGSDATAVAIAVALHADSCEVYTDVARGRLR